MAESHTAPQKVTGRWAKALFWIGAVWLVGALYGLIAGWRPVAEQEYLRIGLQRLALLDVREAIDGSTLAFLCAGLAGLLLARLLSFVQLRVCNSRKPGLTMLGLTIPVLATGGLTVWAWVAPEARTTLRESPLGPGLVALLGFWHKTSCPLPVGMVFAGVVAALHLAARRVDMAALPGPSRA